MDAMDVMSVHTMASPSVIYLSSATIDHLSSLYIIRSRLSSVSDPSL